MINGKICPKHQAEIDAWRGKHGDEFGWGPGHRIPKFDLSSLPGDGKNTRIVDQQVRLIRDSCEKHPEHCSTDPGPEKRCPSPDHDERLRYQF